MVAPALVCEGSPMREDARPFRLALRNHPSCVNRLRFGKRRATRARRYGQSFFTLSPDPAIRPQRKTERHAALLPAGQQRTSCRGRAPDSRSPDVEGGGPDTFAKPEAPRLVGVEESKTMRIRAFEPFVPPRAPDCGNFERSHLWAAPGRGPGRVRTITLSPPWVGPSGLLRNRLRILRPNPETTPVPGCFFWKKKPSGAARPSEKAATERTGGRSAAVATGCPRSPPRNIGAQG